MIGRIICALFGHRYVVERVLSPGARKVGCTRCMKHWAMHDATRSFLEWDSDFEAMYATDGVLSDHLADASKMVCVIAGQEQPAAPAVPLTDDEVIDAVRDADLDWHQGWTLEDDGPNRYEQLVRAVERAHGIGPATAAKTRASCGSSCSP